jgi:hypothetical protein
MTTPLFKLDSDSYLMAYVMGKYSPPSRNTSVPAALGLYFNKDVNTCPYSFCYFGEAGNFMGHCSHIRQDAPVERALLEAWHQYQVLPHYWEVCSKEETEGQLSEPELRIEYIRRLEQFRQTVEEFKRREFARALAYRGNDAKFEANRLFYPTKPADPDIPRIP